MRAITPNQGFGEETGPYIVGEWGEEGMTHLIKSLVLASVDALIEGSDPGLLLLAAGRLEFDVTDLQGRAEKADA